MWDFLVFRRMLTPVLVQILFWLSLAACIMGGVGAMVIGLANLERRPELVGVGLLALVVGPFAVRVYCEWLIVLFRINETLTDIRRNTERGK